MHNFCSLLIEQIIDLEKMRTENLKFKTDLRDRVMDSRSVTQQMIVFKGRLLTKSSYRKSKLDLSTLVTQSTCLPNIAFRLRLIWMHTLDAIDLKSCQTSFPSFCAPPCEVAVLFNSNLSRRPFLGQVDEVVDLDLLLYTGFDSEYAVLFLCRIFTQRPMTDRSKDSAKRWALFWSATTSRQLEFHRKFHFT